MEPIGIDLKAAREEKNISLRTISEETRISLRHLQNLEDTRYGDLPGGMYNRAFLRAYCEYIGLDPDPYLERLELETAPPREKGHKQKVVNVEDRGGIPPLLIWSTMLLLSVAGLYVSRGWIASVFSPYFAQGPATTIASSPVVDLPQELTPLPQTEPTSIESNPAQSASEIDPVALEAAGPVQVASTQEQLPGTLRIQLQVLEKCWVSVNSDGNRVLVKLLEPGDTQSFDASDRFYLILGNAGGIRMKINGMPAKSLGKPGEVIRLLINTQNLHDLVEGTSG